jgi:2-dehydropantoate 2-reductase
MRFGILGSGAVGGYFGALLARTGHDVTFVARGAHLRAIRETGLQIRSVLGDFVVRSRAEEDTARVGEVDCVIVAVKNYDNPDALPRLRPMVGPATVVLTLQNGVDSVDDCAAVVGRSAVLGGTTYIATALEAPGLVVQTGTLRRIVFGEVFEAPEAITPRVAALRDALAGADVEVQAVPDARVPLWEKFVYLSPFAAFTGAARLPIGGLWAHPEVHETFYAAIEEVRHVASAEGVEVTADIRARVEGYLRALPPSTRSSLLIDLQQGKRIEVEALQGSVVRRGRKLNVPTPIHAALYAVLKPYENGPIVKE